MTSHARQCDRQYHRDITSRYREDKRREEQIREDKSRAGEDWHLTQKLIEKKPTEKFTGIVGYHYNFPREGSLYDLLIKGEIKIDE